MLAVYKRVKRLMVIVVSILCFFAVMATGAYTQQTRYPERAIEVITATPGSLSDLYTRSWTGDFSKALKVPVVVVNKGGSMSHLIQCSTAKPDGYALASFSYASLLGYALESKPPIDLFNDFIPIGGFGNFSSVIVVEQSSPFKTFEDLISYAKNNPQKLKCGTPGIHILDHLNFELVKELTKTDIVTVPFKGASQVNTAILGKHVDLVCMAPAGLMGLLKAGRIRALLTVKKLNDFPDVPTFADKGLTEAGMVSWSGLLAPSKIPGNVKMKLVDTFDKVTHDSTVIERIVKMAFTPEHLTPGEMAILMKKDFEKIKTVAKKIGLDE